MWLALEIIVPALIGVATFYLLTRARMTPSEAQRATLRFASVWVPAAVAIIVVAAWLYN